MPSHRQRISRQPVTALRLLALAFPLLAAPLPAQEESPRPMYITRYLVKGARHLPAEEVQAAVYPYLGPGRLPADVDQARAALQKAYHDKGLRSVSVVIPVQRIRRGVVTLQVEENPVGRVRVRGAEFTSPSAIKKIAPSLQEGKPLDFDKLTKEIIALNQTRDRKVNPSLKAGVEPGTFDVDLEVEDELPLHGSLELNNRYSAGTSKLRLNAALSYGNLWQLDHTLGFNAQIAPENLDDARVFSAYYLAPLRSTDGWSLLFQGTKQDSNVSTLGGLAVAGRGEVAGFRAIRNLPPSENFLHSLSLGADYKHFGEDLRFGTGTLSSPITYYPFSLQYSASHKKDNGRTDINAGVTWSFRGLGSSSQEFDFKRSRADGSFIHTRADVSHTRDLSNGYQWFAKIQGQAAGQPLVNSEQFAGGGLGTVRGYLESETLGDNALFGTFEFRGPNLLGTDPKPGDDFRVYTFLEGGAATIEKPLPGQKSSETLASIGVGSRGRFLEHFNGSLDIAYPLLKRPTGLSREFLYTFRLWGDF